MTRTTIDGNNIRTEPTTVSDTESPYTTDKDDIIEVDVSSGAVTITLASADVQAGEKITIIDVSGNASTNNITIETEGSETIDPGAESTKTVSVDNAKYELESDGSNWYAVNANRQSESIDTEQAVLDQQADDGTDRHVIKRADGTEMAEIFSDGSNTVINPLTGAVDLQGPTQINQITALGGDITQPIETRNDQIITQGLLQPDTTNAEDLLAINTTDSTWDASVRVDCVVSFNGGNPSHKVALAKYTNEGSNVTVIDSYRESSFRNQLADPTIDTSNNRILLSSTGTDSASAAQFVMTITGRLNNAALEVL